MTEYIYATDEHEGHWLTGEEIVRCRDCENFNGMDTCNIGCWLCDEPQETNPDGYCWQGKRKVDA